MEILNLEKIVDLPCGENIQQSASVYKNNKMVNYEILNEKELDYNDLVDLTEVLNVISEFFDVNCVVFVNFAKICGVALGSSLFQAYTKAFDCDPISSFYGVIGFSKTVDIEIAKHINSMAIKTIIAPNFDKDALEILKQNSSIKIVKLITDLKDYKKLQIDEIKVTPFGTIIQDKNNSELEKETFSVVTKLKPTPEQIEDAVFAWKISKYTKTNSVVIAKDFKTSAITQGFTNPISATEFALNYSCDNSKEAILACDFTIQSEECVLSAVQGRIGLIIQTGGSIKDKKLIELCDKYGIAMITTAVRNYRY